MTMFTPLKSTPRAMRSVQISTQILPRRKFAMISSRCARVRSAWMTSTWMSSYTSSRYLRGRRERRSRRERHRVHPSRAALIRRERDHSGGLAMQREGKILQVLSASFGLHKDEHRRLQAFLDQLLHRNQLALLPPGEQQALVNRCRSCVPRTDVDADRVVQDG